MSAKGADGGRDVESVAVRLRHEDGRRAVAVWQTDAAGRIAAECAFVWFRGFGAYPRFSFWPRAVAFAAGRAGAYTIKDFVVGTWPAAPLWGSEGDSGDGCEREGA